MGYFIGIDGGGTKTEVALCDEAGRVLYRSVAAGCNPVDIGLERTLELLNHILRELLEKSGIAACQIAAVFSGISGGSAAEIQDICRGRLRSLFSEKTAVECRSDLYNVLNGGLLRRDGCAVISGTGCSCYVRQHSSCRQIGGWGYLFDQKGGGFDIGRDAVSAVLSQLDGRGEDTRLRELLEDKLKQPVVEALPAIYKKGKRYIASLAPLVLEAAGEDFVASRILESNMRGLADLLNTAGKDFKGNFLSVAAGGILIHSELAFQIFCKHITADTKPIRLKAAPVFGALLSAMMLAGIPDEKLLSLPFVSLNNGELGKV